MSLYNQLTLSPTYSAIDGSCSTNILSSITSVITIKYKSVHAYYVSYPMNCVPDSLHLVHRFPSPQIAMWVKNGEKWQKSTPSSDTVSNWRQRWHQPQSSDDFMITETCKPPSSSLKWLLSGYSQPSGLPHEGRNLSLMSPCFSSPIKQKSEIKEDLRGVGKRMKWHHSLPKANYKQIPWVPTLLWLQVNTQNQEAKGTCTKS